LVRVAAVQSSYSPGTIMILVTAGAPRFCRAEYAGWRSVRVAVVRSSYLACDPPIRRRRKYRVLRFDPCTPGHNHGTGHGWCSSTTAANGVSPFPVFGVYEDFDDDADDDHRRSLRVNLRPDRGTEPRRDSGGRRGREQGGRTTTSTWCGRRNDVRY